jgi:sterol desaturase/sphingolipid hydroxylase (fatty acid hydroxylase superfamily)
MIGIPVGLLYSNATEWLVHRYILHGRGKKRTSFWSFHFHEHHSNARRNNHIDEDYRESPLQWNAQGKEALTLTLSTLLHLPLLPVAPFFTATVVYSSLHYYRVHKRSHLDPGWAREHLPWHYDHHMGPDQDCNWCVTRPWFDEIMGTRVPYVGTEREERDRARREARLASRATPPAG